MNRITVNSSGQDISSEQFTIPAILKQENVLRLIEIDHAMYLLNMKDRWERQDREEYVKLGAEREKLRRGE